MCTFPQDVARLLAQLPPKEIPATGSHIPHRMDVQVLQPPLQLPANPRQLPDRELQQMPANHDWKVGMYLDASQRQHSGSCLTGIPGKLAKYLR